MTGPVLQMDPTITSSTSPTISNYTTVPTSSAPNFTSILPPASTLYPITTSSAYAGDSGQQFHSSQTAQSTEIPYTYIQPYAQSSFQPLGSRYYDESPSSYWALGSASSQQSSTSLVYLQGGQYSGSGGYNNVNASAPTYTDLSPVETFLFGDDKDKSQPDRKDFSHLQLLEPRVTTESWYVQQQRPTNEPCLSPMN